MATSVEDLQAHDRQLRRQEALLLEGLAGRQLPREQRRVQSRLLRQTRRELADAGRALHAIQAGWEPFQPAEDWPWGFVEDPRFWAGRTRLVALASASVIAVGAGAALALSGELLAAVALAAVLFGGGQAALHELLGRLAERRDLELREPGGGDVPLFNSAMPPSAAVAYRRAKESGLFDAFTIHSPRLEDFRQVSAQRAPSLGLLDPVLAGRIGRQRFLIAQWDLARDLSSQPAPED